MKARAFFSSRSVATVLLLIMAGAQAAHAETLQSALAKAYRTNPTLTGARAGQRATNETVAIQKSAGRPTAETTAEYQEIVVRPTRSFLAPRRTGSLSGSLNVPIYRGGAVRNGVKAAETRVEAGQANLRATEASLFSQVVAAYMDVIRDSAIVALNQANVRVLEVNLQASNDRFEVGDLTRTDVAQSESRLALAQSDFQTAQANLIASRENFIALVGEAPGTLEPPPLLPGLPATAQDAVRVALGDNPDLIAAKKARVATRYDVRVAKAGVLPTISGFGQGSYTDFLDEDLGTNKQVVVGLTARLPLYQGGLPAAQVRQSQALEAQAMEREVEVERSVIAQTRAAYASWQASLETIDSSQKAVDATSLSLEGVRAENSVGTRTILDILNAEQEALVARVELVSARRNAYVAGFSLLAAMGHAEADDLNLETGALYDPMVDYRRVQGKWSDWSYGPAPALQATPTVDTPAQNANVTPQAAQ